MIMSDGDSDVMVIVSDYLSLCRFCLMLKTQLTSASLERKSSHGAERRGDMESRRGDEKRRRDPHFYIVYIHYPLS